MLRLATANRIQFLFCFAQQIRFLVRADSKEDHGLIWQPLAETDLTFRYLTALLADHKQDAEVARHALAAAATQIQPARYPT